MAGWKQKYSAQIQSLVFRFRVRLHNRCNIRSGNVVGLDGVSGMNQITKPMFSPRLRYMMRKVREVEKARVVVERDENNPNKLNVLFAPDPYLSITLRLTRRKLMILQEQARSQRRKPV